MTVFAALGLGLAWLAWSSDADARALLAALAVCLLLAFGRTTFGSLVEVIPGSADLFFRRFMMGVQLAALLLAGRGAAWLAAGCVRLLEARVPRWPPGLSPAAVLVAAVAVLAPAWLQLGAYDRHDSAAIAAQRRADGTEGADVDRLIAVIERDGGGRTYAGMPSNWGQDFTVGAVPVFKYLESRDVDEVGYTLRTASLMTDPEYFFDDRDPSDYRLFGIRYLILPAGDRAAGARAAGDALRPLLAVDDRRRRLRPGRPDRRCDLGEPDERGRPQRSAASFRARRRTAHISASGTASAVAGMAACRRCEASPPPARSARNAPTSMTARPRRRCGCAVPESRCSAPPTTPGGRQP